MNVLNSTKQYQSESILKTFTEASQKLYIERKMNLRTNHYKESKTQKTIVL